MVNVPPPPVGVVVLVAVAVAVLVAVMVAVLVLVAVVVAVSEDVAVTVAPVTVAVSDASTFAVRLPCACAFGPSRLASPTNPPTATAIAAAAASTVRLLRDFPCSASVIRFLRPSERAWCSRHLPERVLGPTAVPTAGSCVVNGSAPAAWRPRSGQHARASST